MLETLRTYTRMDDEEIKRSIKERGRVLHYLAEKKINVEDLYFRIAGRQVTHLGEVTVPRLLDIKQVQDELRELMAPLGLIVRLQHENLFRVTNEVGSIRMILKGNC